MSELKYYKLFHRASALTSPEFISVVEFGNGDEVYLKSEVDALLAEKDKEIEELKCKKLDVKVAAHVLKAFKFYLCQLTHCAYDELTAQWIIDNWEQDYERVERYHA